MQRMMEEQRKCIRLARAMNKDLLAVSYGDQYWFLQKTLEIFKSQGENVQRDIIGMVENHFNEMNFSRFADAEKKQSLNLIFSKLKMLSDENARHNNVFIRNMMLLCSYVGIAIINEKLNVSPDNVKKLLEVIFKLLEDPQKARAAGKDIYFDTGQEYYVYAKLLNVFTVYWSMENNEFEPLGHNEMAELILTYLSFLKNDDKDYFKRQFIACMFEKLVYKSYWSHLSDANKRKVFEGILNEMPAVLENLPEEKFKNKDANGDIETAAVAVANLMTKYEDLKKLVESPQERLLQIFQGPMRNLLNRCIKHGFCPRPVLLVFANLGKFYKEFSADGKKLCLQVTLEEMKKVINMNVGVESFAMCVASYQNIFVALADLSIDRRTELLNVFIESITPVLTGNASYRTNGKVLEHYKAAINNLLVEVNILLVQECVSQNRVLQMKFLSLGRQIQNCRLPQEIKNEVTEFCSAACAPALIRLIQEQALRRPRTEHTNSRQM